MNGTWKGVEVFLAIIGVCLLIFLLICLLFGIGAACNQRATSFHTSGIAYEWVNPPPGAKSDAVIGTGVNIEGQLIPLAGLSINLEAMVSGYGCGYSTHPVKTVNLTSGPNGRFDSGNLVLKKIDIPEVVAVETPGFRSIWKWTDGLNGEQITVVMVRD